MAVASLDCGLTQFASGILLRFDAVAGGPVPSFYCESAPTNTEVSIDGAPYVSVNGGDLFQGGNYHYVTVKGTVTPGSTVQIGYGQGVKVPGPVNIGIASVTQGTSPWVVSGTVAATQSGTWVMEADGFSVSNPSSSAPGTGYEVIPATDTLGCSMVSVTIKCAGTSGQVVEFQGRNSTSAAWVPIYLWDLNTSPPFLQATVTPALANPQELSYEGTTGFRYFRAVVL